MNSKFSILISATFIFAISFIYGDATLDGISFGDHVSGSKLSKASIEGRIVLFEYWGVNCPPCLRSIPHLKNWQNKYSKNIFVIIANQCQTRDLKAAKAMWDKKGGGSEVSVVNHARLPGAKVSGIPRCFLFDANKKLVYDGSPFGVEKKIDELCKAHPGALVSGMKFKYLKKEAELIGKFKKSFSSMLSILKKKKESENEAIVEEATFLTTRIEEWAEEGKGLVDDLFTKNPVECELELKKRIKMLGSHDLGKWYKEKSIQTKSKEFRKELSAFKKYISRKNMAEKAGLLETPMSKQAAKYLNKFKKSGKLIMKNYADTLAAQKTSDLLEGF